MILLKPINRLPGDLGRDVLAESSLTLGHSRGKLLSSLVRKEVVIWQKKTSIGVTLVLVT